MAKVLLNPIFEAITMRFNNIVFAYKKRMIDVGGFMTQCYIRPFVSGVRDFPQQRSIRSAWSIISNKWTAMSAADKQTWRDQGEIFSSDAGYDLFGYQCMMGYFMAQFDGQCSPWAIPVDLVATTDYTYANRLTVDWTCQAI